MTGKRFEIREEDIIVEYHELEGLHTCIRNNGEFMTYQQIVDLLNELHEENKELKDLLKSMADRNNEIWLNNGQIIRLKKVFKGRMDK